MPNLADYAKKHRKNIPQTFLFSFKEELKLVKTNKNDSEFAYFYTTHYPDSLGIIGRQFNYKILFGNEFIGIVGANSWPFSMIVFRKYFNNDKLNTKILNNNVYRVIKSKENRGTQILKIFRERIYEDYYKKYNEFLLGLITFVEPPRKGTVYKADNWDYLGMTQGVHVTQRKEDGKGRKFDKEGTKKHIYGMKFPDRYKNRIENKKKMIKNNIKIRNKNYSFEELEKIFMKIWNKDLLKSTYKKEYDTKHKSYGMCYITSEFLFHELKLYNKCIPKRLTWEESSHWYLEVNNKIIDFTKKQFKETPNYKLSKNASFLTKEPSKRCKIFRERFNNITKKKNKQISIIKY